eukprot:TRINITY_DN4554_c1_g1_i1.p1 TRINITY_DN4554_c1_g1~~TRINITY_DN4554_c1_g1_i1.p1  ORF type:complete len:256 (+),score=42.47 TRINITY_DN4554_c1_g1_i1:262-1029(+)
MSIGALMEQALELFLHCGHASCAPGSLVLGDLEIEAKLEQHNSHVEMSMAAPEASMHDTVHGVRLNCRLRLLMQKLPQPGKQMHSSFKHNIHELFEAKWFLAYKPLDNLLQCVISMSVAAWRCAAGLSLLDWVVEQCATGAEARVTGMALNALSEARQLQAVTKLQATNAVDGTSQGTPLARMALHDSLQVQLGFESCSPKPGDHLEVALPLLRTILSSAFPGNESWRDMVCIFIFFVEIQFASRSKGKLEIHRD